MSEMVLKMVLQGDGTGAVEVVKSTIAEFEKLGKSGDTAGDKIKDGMDKAEDGTERVKKGAKGAKDGIEGVAASLSRAEKAFIGYFSITKIKDLAFSFGSMALEVNGFKNQLKLVSDTQEEYNYLQESALAIADEVGTSIGVIGSAFARLNPAIKETGGSSKDTALVVKALNDALLINKVSTAESASVNLQFAQAMASGVLAGDELKSIMENSNVFARALADGLDVTTGQLKKMGAAGELTAEKVVAALKKQAAALAEQAATMDALPQAWQRLKTAVTLWVGEAEETYNITGQLSDAINYLARNFDTVISAAGNLALALGTLLIARTVGRAFAGMKLASVATDMTKLVTATKGASAGTLALKGMGSALGLIGGPVGFAIIAATALATFSTSAQAAQFDTESFTSEIDSLRDSFMDLTEAKLDMALLDIATNIQSAEKNARDLQDEIDRLSEKTRGGHKQQMARLSERTTKEKELASAVEDLQEGQLLQAEMQEQLNDLQTETIEVQKESTDALKDGKDATDDKAGADKSATIEINKQKEAYKQLRYQINPLEKEFDDYADNLNVLSRELNSGRISQEEFTAQVAALDEQMLGLNEITETTGGTVKATGDTVKTEAKKIEQAADPMAEAWAKAMERIDAAFADAWKGAFDSFKDFSRSIGDAFKTMLAEMAHQAITKPILMQFGLGGAGGVPVGGLMGGVTNAIGGGLNYLGGMFGGAGGQHASMLAEQTGVFGAQGAAMTNQALGGIGPAGVSFGGLALAGGLGYLGADALGGENAGIGGGLGGAVGMAMGGPFGAALGSALGGAVGKFIGQESEQRHNQFVFDYSGGDLTGTDTYMRAEKQFGSVSKEWIENEMDSEIMAAVTDSMDAYRASATKIGEAFGMGAEDIQSSLDSYAVDFKLNIEDLSAEEVEEAISEWLSSVGAELIATATPHVAGLIEAVGSLSDQIIAPLMDLGTYINADFAAPIQESFSEASNRTMQAVRDSADVLKEKVSWDTSALSGAEMAALSILGGAKIIDKDISAASLEWMGINVQRVGSEEEIAAATQQLADVAMQRYEFELQTLQAVTAVRDFVSASVEGFQDQIWRETSTTDELITEYSRRRIEAYNALSEATDPEEVKRLTQEAIASAQAGFALASDEEKKILAESMNQFATDVDTAAKTRLSQIEQDTLNSHEVTADVVSAALQAASQNQFAASESMNGAAANLNTAAISLNNSAGSIIEANEQKATTVSRTNTGAVVESGYWGSTTGGKASLWGN